jgi:rod shape-determining protein MreC
MEYSPPPLFKQGASARAKVVFFSLIAIAMLVTDARFRTLTMIRQAVGTVLYPVQRVALVPRDVIFGMGGYFITLSSVERENAALRLQHSASAQQLQQSQQLAAENNHLRKLLGASEQIPVPTIMSEILYDARDAFTRKIVLDRGMKHGIAPGQPVIDDVGVVGQVTRVFPFTSEVTLLTDKDQAIPVQVVRSGLRSVAYGRGQSGRLDLRFMAANADVRNGDVLVTSGIDGVYPPGLAVATVINVESKSTDAFAHIECQPTAGIDRNRQLLILLANAPVAQRPESEDDRDKKDKLGKKRSREMGREKDSGKEPATDGGASSAALKAEPKEGAKPAGIASAAPVTKPAAVINPAPAGKPVAVTKPAPATKPAPSTKPAAVVKPPVTPVTVPPQPQSRAPTP